MLWPPAQDRQTIQIAFHALQHWPDLVLKCGQLSIRIPIELSRVVAWPADEIMTGCSNAHYKHQFNSISFIFIQFSNITITTYLSINGKCKRSVMADSNGLTIFRKRDGGVGVFTIGNE